MKRNNIRITGVTKGEGEQETENLFEKVITENSPNLMTEKVMQVLELHRVPIKMNPKKSTARHSIYKMSKLKTKREC